MKLNFSFWLALGLAVGFFGCAQKQPHTSTYDYFSGKSETGNPVGGLALSGHTLYGTCAGEAMGWSSVFKVGTDGGGFAILHHFTPTADAAVTNGDGASPRGRLVLSGDTLYGTTQEGGRSNCGTIFKVKTDGSGYAVLHHFNGFKDSGGGRPAAGLVLAGDTLYGTAERGGLNLGTVFKLNTDGSSFAVLHTFTELSGPHYTNADGAFPKSELVLSGNTLYGTAWCGGPGGCGTVFAVNTDGSRFCVLHSFSRQIVDRTRSTFRAINADGAYPEFGLALSGDELFGTASQGGLDGSGTVFRIKVDGSGFATLHTFSWIGNVYPEMANVDGGNPENLQLSGNVIYGCASDGGVNNRGTLFRLNRDGSGFAVLPVFGNSSVGRVAGFIKDGDKFYGNTEFGGKHGGGVVFKTDIRGRAPVVLHSFIERPLPPGLSD